jgi:hypothetical protein
MRQLQSRQSDVVASRLSLFPSVDEPARRVIIAICVKGSPRETHCIDIGHLFDGAGWNT